MDFRSREKHNRSRRGHVMAYRTVRAARATLVVTCSNREFGINFYNNIFNCFHYEFYLQFEVNFLYNNFHMPSYGTLFLGVTYSKCATHKFAIHQINAHGNVLIELMPLSVV